VNTLLAEEPAAQQSPPPADGLPQGDLAPPRDGPACSSCSAELAPEQEWCLRCGAGRQRTRGSRLAWRPLGISLALTGALVAGAAVAAYAALKEHSPPAPKPSPAAAVQTPAAPPPAAPSTGSATSPTTAQVLKPLQLPSKTSQPPKIPLQATTPTATTPPAATTTPTTTTPSKPAKAEAKPPAPIVLDTNAASTYNPLAYPEANFGEPALAIDGEAKTVWTAQVEPTVAPKMAEGLVIDLNHAQRVGSIAILTDTPGMTIEVYGSTASAPPAAITDPGWTQLATGQVIKKQKHDKAMEVKLHHKTKAFRFILLWLTKAPQSAAGSLQAPGHIDINELELFPPAKG
jgi:hypothetical protein